MKKKLFAAILFAVAACMCMCAFTLDMNSSVKSLTKPYIATYDCTFAQLGKENLLEKYDYLKITFIDDEKLEVSFKKKNGKRHSYTAPYTYDDETGELKAEIGILGFKFRQATKIENGKFNLSMPILGKQLSMVFAS
ncbi:MAG: hypothetical protein NC033_06150 [Clostridiales bacterium]|nr:hypothetical protein [Clostridiales bacterium]